MSSIPQDALAQGRAAPNSDNTPVERRPEQETQRPVVEAQQSQKQYNAAILQANYEVSLSTQNQPQALVYKAAIDAINKELEADLGPNAIEEGYETGLDVSPEATAGRIVNMTTSLFTLYQESNPDLSFEEQVNKFLEVVRGGVDQGFDEAKEILDGLGVLEGEIAENIDKTYDLVQEGFDAFRERLLDSTPNDDQQATSEQEVT